MRTILEVKREIETLQNHNQIITNIVNKMRDNADVRCFMNDNFNVDIIPMSKIAADLSVMAHRLENALDEIEVDI